MGKTTASFLPVSSVINCVAGIKIIYFNQRYAYKLPFRPKNLSDGQTIILNAEKLINSMYDEKLGRRYKITYDDGTSEIVYKNQKFTMAGGLVKDILDKSDRS